MFPAKRIIVAEPAHFGYNQGYYGGKQPRWRTFIAMFSSEHIAGTEFVLGTLLVLHGVTAFDVFVGLAVGNLLAVLSWALMCAPIAVKERLTIYWQIRKIAGPYSVFQNQ